jgi:hypothetical protein
MANGQTTDFEADLIRKVASAREALARLVMAIAPLAEISEEAERAARDLVERLKAEVQAAIAGQFIRAIAGTATRGCASPHGPWRLGDTLKERRRTE